MRFDTERRSRSTGAVCARMEGDVSQGAAYAELVRRAGTRTRAQARCYINTLPGARGAQGARGLTGFARAPQPGLFGATRLALQRNGPSRASSSPRGTALRYTCMSDSLTEAASWACAGGRTVT